MTADDFAILREEAIAKEKMSEQAVKDERAAEEKRQADMNTKARNTATDLAAKLSASLGTQTLRELDSPLTVEPVYDRIPRVETRTNTRAIVIAAKCNSDNIRLSTGLTCLTVDEAVDNVLTYIAITPKPDWMENAKLAQKFLS